MFIATSPIHLEHKLKMSQEEVLASIKEHVSYAKQFFEVVQFSLKMRLEPKFRS